MAVNSPLFILVLLKQCSYKNALEEITPHSLIPVYYSLKY